MVFLQKKKKSTHWFTMWLKKIIYIVNNKQSSNENFIENDVKVCCVVFGCYEHYSWKCPDRKCSNRSWGMLSVRRNTWPYLLFPAGAAGPKEHMYRKDLPTEKSLTVGINIPTKLLTVVFVRKLLFTLHIMLRNTIKL